MNHKLNKHQEFTGVKKIIPNEYPKDLQKCLQIFENIKYKSFGFPIVFLDYNYYKKKWSMFFRNAANFENPEIEEDTPIEAVYKMLDFLKSLKK